MEGLVPAHVSLLALYNPAFGKSDETLHDQVVFYYSAKSRDAQRPKGRSQDGLSGQRSNNERNEMLRRIGLAQGMVEFAKSETNYISRSDVD